MDKVTDDYGQVFFRPLYAGIKKKGKGFDDGWIGGDPPSLSNECWPRISISGNLKRLREGGHVNTSDPAWLQQLAVCPDADITRIPMRHVWTVRLPQEFRCVDSCYVAISLFEADFGSLAKHIAKCAGETARPSGVPDPKNLFRSEDQIAHSFEFACYWHTEESFNGKLCKPPRCCENKESAHLDYFKEPYRRDGRRAAITLSQEKPDHYLFTVGGIPAPIQGYDDELEPWEEQPILLFDRNDRYHILNLKGMNHYYDC